MRCLRRFDLRLPAPTQLSALPGFARRTVKAAASSSSSGKGAKMTQEDVKPVHEYSRRWESTWSGGGGLKPGQAFDAGRSPLVLTQKLASGELQAAGQRVFVPGCGRGYDVVTFVRAGAEAATGLELAPTAQQAACEYVQGELTGEEGAKAEVCAGDFFRWQPPSGQPFTLGFDYTFFCALHPDMRADWAAAWARYMAPGGRLVCLAFPIDPERTTGPPWPVTPQQYRDFLEPVGFQLETDEPVPAEVSHPGRGGMERWMVFVRQ